MLIFLNEHNKYHRILRRGIVIGALTCMSVILYDSMIFAPEWIIPVLAAIGAMLDKSLREYKNN